ncbi:hypothetical protein ACFO3O_11505 [Dokdonia ponticola]|uniref:Lipoprotein n=1 Tax=Dokdonia ponticola TaxID=2041041 RepID=A0ABV9HX97_9FLAO
MKHSRLLISLIAFVFFACQTNSKCSYLYFDGLENYLSEIHSVELHEIEDTILYITPISNNCENCIKINLDMLQDVDNNRLMPILVGDDVANKYKGKIQKIENTFSKTLYDKEELVYSFRTGFSKPLLIHIVNGNCIYFLEVNDFVLNEAASYIDANR